MPPADLLDRRIVEVEVDGGRFPGKLRSRDELPDGSVSCLVTWQPAPGLVQTGRVAPHQVHSR